MPRRPALAAFFVALLLVTAPASAQRWRLVWSDEFNGPANSTPAAGDWNFVRGWGPKGNHEIQFYCRPTDDDGPCERKDPNTYLDGEGHLVLRATHTGQRWSSARLNTQGKHEILYGRVEARLRMEPGAGFWPAFWLLGNDHETAGWPACGEQDIIEWVQKYGASATSSTVHGPGYSGAHGIGATYSFPPNADGTPGRIDDGAFHTYGMTWSPNRMEFYRDDPAKPFLVLTPDKLPAGTKWVYDHPFYVILNFAIGEAGFPGSTDESTPKTGRMWVDYVRFYQQ